MQYNEKSYSLGSKRSIIREIFEYSKTRAKEIGAENVFDFSLGNPSVEPPKEVLESLEQLLKEKNQTLLHGYTSAQGDLNVRKAISDNINTRFNLSLTPDNIYMTCGAAASLSICLKAVMNVGDECIVFAPFFTEYRVFVENAGGKLVISTPENGTLQVDVEDFESKITENTKAIIMDSPNNPSGVVYTKQELQKLAEVVLKYGIYVVSDEIYEKLNYGKDSHYSIAQVSEEMKKLTIVINGVSKAYAMTGWRIGYLACDEQIAKVINNVQSHTTSNATSISQYASVTALNEGDEFIKEMHDIFADRKNYIVEKLNEYNFEFINPDGAFYVFVNIFVTNITINIIPIFQMILLLIL